MTKRERAVWILLWAALIIALAVPVKSLFVDGVYSWHIRQPEFVKMVLETAGLALILGLVWFFVRECRMRLILTGAVCAAFVWCHVVFLPMALSGIYVGYLYLMGCTVRTRLIRAPGRMEDGWLWDFLLGCAAVILMFCAMSAVGAGSLLMMKGAAVGTGAFAAAVSGPAAVHELKEYFSGPKRDADQKKQLKALLFVFMLLMVLIQVGRMNISLDFDSLWYGVRSEYILNNGHGIYENMGSVGLVYTYSKGLEVLLLPLSGMASHSYLIFFNVWMAVMCLMAVYRIGRFYMSRTYAMLAAACVSSIPAVMNMSITAKTDTMTLLTQLAMILYLLHHLLDKRNSYFFAAFGTCLLSWTLKPTTVIFSTAVFGMSVLYLLATGQLSLRVGWRGWAQLIFPSAALTGIWARTVSMVGIPVTSVFSSVFLKLGFHLKYPFSVLPVSAGSVEEGSMLPYLADTLYRMLLNPTGENMSHVVIAWGTSLLFFLPAAMVLISVSIRCGGNRKSQAVTAERAYDRGDSRNLIRFAHTVMIPFTMVCLISLTMLGQIDGNYFMLLYVGIVLYGCTAVSRVDSQPLRKWIFLMISALLLFNVPVTMVSNWAWSLGFTPAAVMNKGRMNHKELKHQEMISLGNAGIWDILEKDPKTRVIAAGEHPQVFNFPCNVQSYDDITSTWGNVALVKTMDNFLEYLAYAKTDYIYMQAGYVEKGSRCYELMGYLVEAGVLTDAVFENGNLLARVELQGAYGPEASAAYAAYQSGYQVRE